MHTRHGMSNKVKVMLVDGRLQRLMRARRTRGCAGSMEDGNMKMDEKMMEEL